MEQCSFGNVGAGVIMPDRDTRQGAVQGIADIYARETPYNQLSFLMRSLINKEINTAIPVQVTKVMVGSGSVGYVQAKPLVNDMDAEGNAVDVPVIPSLPYFRLQGGKVAIITDPVVGDIGIAVFAQKDTSNVVAGTSSPVRAGSFRKFSMSDGWYIGGFLNASPETFIELKQDKTIIITANNGITFNGNISVNGTITATGDIQGNGHSLTNHYHHGVHGDTSTSIN